MRLFDLHCDTLGVATDGNLAITENTAAVDLRRGGTFRQWTQAFAAFLPDGRTAEESRLRCDDLLNTANRFSRETARFIPVTTVADLCDMQPLCRCLLTVENGGVTAGDEAYLRHLYDRGVRVVGLTWNGDNPWGSGCFGSDVGLTSAGMQALRDMERIGLVADVSHLGEPAFWQVVKTAKGPFVATHSNAAAVCWHPRNLTDEQFRAVRDSGGVVGLNLYGPHLGEWSFEAFRRHLEHFLSLDGERTVCIGADLDGMEIPPGWDGISVMKELWQHLRQAGYTPALLDAVFYKNAFEFFEKILPKE